MLKQLPLFIVRKILDVGAGTGRVAEQVLTNIDIIVIVYSIGALSIT